MLSLLFGYACGYLVGGIFLCWLGYKLFRLVFSAHTLAWLASVGKFGLIVLGVVLFICFLAYIGSLVNNDE